MRLKKWKIIFRILFNPKNKKFGLRFNDYLSGIIEYGVDNHEHNRGVGACDVMFYTLSYGKDLIK